MDPALLAQVIFNIKKLEKEEKKAEREAKREAKEDFEPEPEEDKGDGRWRFEARTVFLTYPHSDDVTPEDVLACLDEAFPDQVKSYDVAQEQHKDGSNHLHALVTFKDKIRTRDNTAFDLYRDPDTGETLYHPNIQSARNKDAIRSYIYKGHGDFAPVVVSSQRFDWSKIGNFKKRREDYIEYKRELLLAKQKKVIEHFTCYNCLFDLTPGVKKRHFWFFGEFSTGKSTEVYKNNFKDKVLSYKVRAPHGDSYWGCFDGYKQEKYVVFDDSESKLSKGLICSLAAVEDSEVGETPVACRYKDVVWFNEVILIVLSNQVPGYHYQEDWREEGWFRARFMCVEVVKGEDGVGKIGKIDSVDFEL